MKTYPTFFGGEVKEEWGCQVGVGEQVMSKFKCVMNITLNKSSGRVAFTLILDTVLLFINTFTSPGFLHIH